jgi:hypothetical protein
MGDAEVVRLEHAAERFRLRGGVPGDPARLPMKGVDRRRYLLDT